MSFSRSLTSALYRSIDQAKNTLASAVRMDVTPPTSHSHGRLPLYSITTANDVSAFATGSDVDMGGKSTMKFVLDGKEGRGRFFGTLSNEVPPGARLERSGYAGFRNKNRPTLFGTQTWDTTVHPYLCLRVRNRLAGPPSAQQATFSGGGGGGGGGGGSPSSSSSLRSALASPSLYGDKTTAYARASQALGLGANNRPGPKFFVNIQTDGPVTSDLFQHRLLLDESKGDAWQDVVIPLDDFVLINTGVVSASQIKMMREKVRTIGISAVLELPSIGDLAKQSTPSTRDDVPNALSSDDVQTQTVRGSRRAATYNFDLGVERIEAITKEVFTEERGEAASERVNGTL